jgi:NADPH-dependent 7-cyano-7-deazaguanine reductase QueF
MGKVNYKEVLYGTSTLKRYLKKFHDVEISSEDLNKRLEEVIFEEIDEEEVQHGISG